MLSCPLLMLGLGEALLRRGGLLRGGPAAGGWLQQRGLARRAAAPDKLQRLERIIANRGVGSRKEVAALFKQGRVRVNGKVVLSGADRYPMSTAVDIEGLGAVDRVPLLAVYNKPVGVVSTMRDDWGRLSLSELQLEFPYLKSMHPVGRLDSDTSGLLLFSSDGVLTQTLLHPSTGVDRVYEALVVGRVDAQRLGPVLGAGVETTEGTFAAALLEASPSDELVPLRDVVPPPPPATGQQQPGAGTGAVAGKRGGAQRAKAAAKTGRGAREKAGRAGGDDEDFADEEGGEGGAPTPLAVDPSFVTADPRGEACVVTSSVRVSVTEGKYRMVRRVLHNSGHSVVRLHRLRYGALLLGALEEGEVRAASGEEEAWARRLLAGGGGKAAGAGV